MITGASYLQLGTLFAAQRKEHTMKITINFDMSEKETATAVEKAADIVGGLVHARVETAKLGLGFLGQLAEATRDLALEAIKTDAAIKNMRPVKELRGMLREVMDSDEELKLSLRDSDGEVTVENADQRTLELTERVHELEKGQVEWEQNSESRMNELEEQILTALREDHGVKPARKAPRDNGS